MDARERVLELINAAWTTQAIGVACELGLPDRLANGPSSAGDLAAATSTDAQALERLLRALGTVQAAVTGVSGLTAAVDGLITSVHRLA